MADALCSAKNPSMKIFTFAVGLLSAALAGELAPGAVWTIELEDQLRIAPNTDLTPSPSRHTIGCMSTRLPRVLLVGHCGADNSYMRMALKAADPEVEIVPIHDQAELAAELEQGADLVL